MKSEKSLKKEIKKEIEKWLGKCIDGREQLLVEYAFFAGMNKVNIAIAKAITPKEGAK